MCNCQPLECISRLFRALCCRQIELQEMNGPKAAGGVRLSDVIHSTVELVL